MINCTGPASGTTVKANFVFSLNTNITSKLLSAGGPPETLILTGEPSPEQQVYGTNVFTGHLLAANKLAFDNVPLRFASWGATLRLVNLRVDATSLPPPQSLTPTYVLLQTVMSSTDASVALAGQDQTLAYIGLNDLRGDLRDARNESSAPSDFQLCNGQNETLPAGGFVASAIPTFQLRFREGIGIEFRKAYYSALDAPPEAQAGPGLVYFTETGFFNPALTGIAGAGLATQGTRLRANFTGIPDGVAVYVTTKPSPRGTTFQTSYGAPLTDAVLVAADVTGGGKSEPIQPSGTVLIDGQVLGIAPLMVKDGAAVAVWEITNAWPGEVETAEFAVYLAYPADGPQPGVIRINMGYGPVSADISASAVSPVPRFADNSSSWRLNLKLCDTGSDLITERVDASNAMTPGAASPVSAVVLNRGSEPAVASTLAFGLYQDSDTTKFVASLGSCSIPALGGGQRAGCTVQAVVPATVPTGNYFVAARADAGNAVAESSELNNTNRVGYVAVRPCAWSLRNGAGSYPASATTIAWVDLFTDPSCSWTLDSDPFIQITSLKSGQGPGSLNFNVLANTGPQRVGYIRINGSTAFTVTQAAGSEPPIPNLTALTAATTPVDDGTHRLQIGFVRDTQQALDSAVLYVLVASDISGANACLLEYTPASESWRLMTDSGTEWSAPVRFVGPLSNSQCTFVWATHSMGGGTSQNEKHTVVIDLATNPRFSGQKRIYLKAVNRTAGVETDWIQAALWNIRGNTPAVESLTPTQGTGRSGVFTGVFINSGGKDAHYLAYMLFLPTPNVTRFTARGTCLVEYNRISNGVRLINDAGEDWLGPISGVPIRPGAPALSNKQCSVNVASVAATIADTKLTLQVPVTFSATFNGVLGTFLQGFDTAGNFTGMTQFGNWTAGAATTQPYGPQIAAYSAPPLVGRTATYSLTASHLGGASKLGLISLLIGDSISDRNPCQVVVLSGGDFNLIDDSGTALTNAQPVRAGTQATAVNSRCIMGGPGLTYTTTANSVSLKIPVTFLQGFSGSKKVYAVAFDAELVSHWVEIGSLTLP